MRTLTKYAVGAVLALAGFVASPQGQAIISKNRYLSAAGVLIGGLALLFHNTQKGQ